VGFYVSGQFLTEDYYVYNKLAKGLIGTNNIDTNSRLAWNPRRQLQADARRGRAARCYEDVDSAECVFIEAATPLGSPGSFQEDRTGEARHLIVVDTRERPRPRAPANAAFADRARLRCRLFNGMLRVMLRRAGATKATSAGIPRILNRLRRS